MKLQVAIVSRKIKFQPLFLLTMLFAFSTGVLAATPCENLEALVIEFRAHQTTAEEARAKFHNGVEEYIEAADEEEPTITTEDVRDMNTLRRATNTVVREIRDGNKDIITHIETDLIPALQPLLCS